MRYIVTQHFLGVDHPLWPNTAVYKIKDTKIDRLLPSSYLKEEAAQKVVDQKNQSDVLTPQH